MSVGHAARPLSPEKPSIVVAAGFHEDGWHSMRLLAEHLMSKCLSEEDLPFCPQLYAPHLGRAPRWYDRRLSYGRQLPPGEIFHLIDQSYGDCLFRARERFSRVVTIIHDLAFWHERTLLNSFFRERIRRGLALADYRISPSRQVAREIQTELGLTVHGIIPTAVSLPHFPHSDGKRVPGRLLQVGSTMPRKGVDRALRFVAGLPEPFHLHHLGEPLRKEHLRLARQLGVEGRLTVRHFVSDADLTRTYQEAQALIFPSRYEGYGLPPVEARLCGTVALVSNAVPSAELLSSDPGTHTFDFDAFDPFQPDERRRAAWAAFGRLALDPLALGDREKFGWERATRQYRAVYESLLALPRRAGPRG